MRLLLYFLAISLFFSCKSLAPNRMFTTDQRYPFAVDSLADAKAYVIAPFDHVTINVFSNDGFKLVDVVSQGYVDISRQVIEYVLNADGAVKLPVVGTVVLKDLTVEQAERLLEEKYNRYFNQSYVHLSVLNRKAIVFIGDGKGQVVPLTHENTTLYEVLAMAGGMTDYAKAFRVNIIRGEGKDSKIYSADLSTMEGIRSGKVYIQSNDIISVEAYPNYLFRLNQRILPLLGIVSTTLLLLTLINR